MTQLPIRSASDTDVLVALGANVTQGQRSLSDSLETAIQALDCATCRVLEKSRFFNTPCFPKDAGPDYINAAIRCKTSLGAEAVLSHLHTVEARLGRERVQRWGSRTIDLDLLAFGQAIIPNLDGFIHWRDLADAEKAVRVPDTLILPHPRMAERAFVLIPLLDIAPDWRHPVSGLTVRQMAAALPAADKSAVTPVIG